MQLLKNFDFYSKVTDIILINAYISAVFILINIIFIILIFYFRIVKNRYAIQKKTLEGKMIELINNVLFDEKQDISELQKFKNSFLKSTFAKHVAVESILVFAKNLKGESNKVLLSTFKTLELDKFMMNKLKNPIWHRKARSLYIITNIGLEIDESLIPKLLNHPKFEVRLQTILYYIRMHQNNPLTFLNDLKAPLTLWQQIYIEDALKHHQGKIPDFSQWLDHSQTSVVIFSIKMIANYNQYENIPKLLLFMNKENDLLKIHALKALSVLGHHEMVDFFDF